MGAKTKERRVIQGLASFLGLDSEADAWTVLKTAAETLGCTVANDGTTSLPEVIKS